jgi:superfamily II DNA/RNA helicase
MVATDIAARGIHVDVVALVVHADPPAEHKAYLHRSGRTARAGADGTVVTLMTDDQVTEVGLLARRAGISATTTRLRPGDPLLRQLAPGERTYAAIVTPTKSSAAPRKSTVDDAAPARAGRPRARHPRRRSTSAVTSSTAGAAAFSAKSGIGRRAR